jgi:hypothetical protein
VRDIALCMCVCVFSNVVNFGKIKFSWLNIGSNDNVERFCGENRLSSFCWEILVCLCVCVCGWGENSDGHEHLSETCRDNGKLGKLFEFYGFRRAYRNKQAVLSTVYYKFLLWNDFIFWYIFMLHICTLSVYASCVCVFGRCFEIKNHCLNIWNFLIS